MDLSRRQILHNFGYLSAGCLGFGFCGCKSAPVTRRRQLILIPEGQEIALGMKAFEETVATEKLSSNVTLNQIVQRVGQRISAVSNRNDYDWDFRLIEEETQNAFCLPGGKVAIYEGILPVCEDEAGLAVVMSHEIAHALARHGGERMSQSMASDTVKGFAEKLAGKYVPDKSELLMQAYGLGTKYGVLLPYSRKQESEADHIGIRLMAEAGYDPAVAPDFWNRFAAMKGAGQPAEFMSTHPSDQRRAADLMQLMDEAQSIYRASSTKHGRGERMVGN